MPTLAQVRTYVDGKLSDLWNVADARQVTYAASRGRYWQGLITCRIGLLPNNTLAAPSTVEIPLVDDEVVGVAGSHEVGWKGAFANIPVSLPAAFVADEWVSSKGIGWMLTVYVRVAGRVYTRSRAHMEDHSIVTTQWSEVI